MNFLWDVLPLSKVLPPIAGREGGGGGGGGGGGCTGIPSLPL